MVLSPQPESPLSGAGEIHVDGTRPRSSYISSGRNEPDRAIEHITCVVLVVLGP